VTPDHWELSPAGDLLRSRIADKKVATVPAASGARQMEVETERRRRPCLDIRTLHDLANLARACEELFGAPQDVEWAMDDSKIWLLQSRPITSSNS
jgi:pyruvate,water dikinase